MSGMNSGQDEPRDAQATALAVLATSLHLQAQSTNGQAASPSEMSDTELQAALRVIRRITADVQSIVVARPTTPLPAQFLLSVVMPVYNERNTISEIIDRVRSVDLPKEIIVVDDGSSDGTREFLRSDVEGKVPQVQVLYHSRNLGKGAAVRTGIAHTSGTVCLIQDADLEYNPQEYLQLLEPILDGRADAVYGSRFLGGGPHRVHLFWHYVGNKLLTTLSNMLTNLNLTDMETCYKVVRSDLLRSLPLRSNGFEIEPELTALLARARARVYEVPISYSGRDYSEGKKVGWQDGIKAINCIIKSNLQRRSE